MELIPNNQENKTISSLIFNIIMIMWVEVFIHADTSHCFSPEITKF